MRVVVPDYYNDFVCIADKCSHSCCIGWEIDIDPATLGYYDSLQGEAGERIRESVVRDDTPHFRLGDNERCPHLDERGLCRIISDIGEDAICDICTEHPRFRSFFIGREEVGLGLCCEEVCRIILGKTEPVHLVTAGDDGEDDTDDGAETEFMDLRENIFRILQDRSLDIDGRIEALLTEYSCSMPHTDTAEWCDFFLSLERLDGEWGNLLELLRDSEVKYLDKCSTKLPGESGEQLLVYFIYRHLSGAVSDGNYMSRIKLAVMCFYMIRALCAVSSKAEVDLPIVCDVARMFSSEIEYSEENIAELLFELSF